MQQTLTFIFLYDLKCEFAWYVSDRASSVVCTCEEELVQVFIASAELHLNSSKERFALY